MKIGLSFILVYFFLFPPPMLVPIGLGYKGVMRSNARFGQTEQQYYSQEFIFATDTVSNCGVIRFAGEKENTTIPIKTPVSKKRKKGTNWIETFQNDTIFLTLKGSPTDRKMQSSFWYDIEMEMVMKKDTIREEWIGHCTF
jgi:hypothetical protein